MKRLIVTLVGVVIFLVLWCCSYVFLNDSVFPKSTIESEISNLKGKRFIVIGHDPSLKGPWKITHGSRGSSGEYADDWTVITFRDPQDAEKAETRMLNLNEEKRR